MATALAVLLAGTALAGPQPTCCICACDGLVVCEQSDTTLCAACGGGLNQTCESSAVPGSCSAVAACTGIGAAAAPAMGPNIMAVLAALLGATGVLRVRRKRRKSK